MTLREKVQSFLEKYSLAQVLNSRLVQEELTDIYAELTGKILSCATCGDSVIIAMGDLEVFVRRDEKKPAHNQLHNKMYQLKKDAVVFCKAHHRHYTWESITDEAAKIILSENPNNANFFAVIPSDEAAPVQDTITVDSAKASEVLNTDEVVKEEKPKPQTAGNNKKKGKR